jgi:hypothetical protein
MTSDAFIGTRGDFDFLVGNFTVRSRRLVERLAGSTQWDESEAACTGFTLQDGCISVDEFDFPSMGLVGTTFRTLNHEARKWSIYWVSSRDGFLQPPVHGGFSGEKGEFYGDDVYAGRPIKVRFLWQRPPSPVIRWEQSFSLDGKDWEPNWVMELRRRES